MTPLRFVLALICTAVAATSLGTPAHSSPAAHQTPESLRTVDHTHDVRSVAQDPAPDRASARATYDRVDIRVVTYKNGYTTLPDSTTRRRFHVRAAMGAIASSNHVQRLVTEFSSGDATYRLVFNNLGNGPRLFTVAPATGERTKVTLPWYAFNTRLGGAISASIPAAVLDGHDVTGLTTRSTHRTETRLLSDHTRRDDRHLNLGTR